MKAPESNLLTLKHDGLLSSFAFKFNLRRYIQRYTPFPGNVVAGMVACTGAQFCGFAQIETKKQAYTVAEHLESVLTFPNGDIRMIWTGCPNSCAPVQVADIGLMGCQERAHNRLLFSST